MKYKNKLNLALSSLPNFKSISLIDIGAAGDIEPRWKCIEPNLSYVGFEPDERSRANLIKKHNLCASHQIFPFALGSKYNEAIPLNLCRNSQVSSTYTPNNEFLGLFPDSSRFDVISTSNLISRRLDDLGLTEFDFLKIDTQGSELDILKGATSSLRSVLGLEIEVEFMELYKKQPLFGEVVKFLNSQGFEFIDFVNLCRWERREYNGHGQCVFGDALFLRSPESLLALKVTPKKLSGYFGCLLLYNRFDLIDQTYYLLSTDRQKEFKLFLKKIKIIRNRFKYVKKINYVNSRILNRLGHNFRSHLIY